MRSFAQTHVDTLQIFKWDHSQKAEAEVATCCLKNCDFETESLQICYICSV